MFATVDTEKQQILALLDNRIRDHHDASDVADIIQFARDYFNDHTGDALARQELDSLYTRVLDCWRFIQRRQTRLAPSQVWEEQLQQIGGMAAPHQYTFSSAYREHFTPEQAAQDIALIDSIVDADELASSFGPVDPARPDRFYFKLISRQDSLVLSDVVPILENLGVRVIGEHPYAVSSGGDQRVWIHDFKLATQFSDSGKLESIKPLFRDAFDRTWQGQAENDEFNRLVLAASLNWRQAALLRAYARYLRQTRFNFSQSFIADALCRQPRLTRLLVGLFEQRFDPASGPNLRVLEQTEAEILQTLDRVENLDEDRIIRRYLELIQATVRTNYYQPDANGSAKDYVSFKFDPQGISDLPKPRPKYEIFVYSPRMEGVHLRAGKVARGGLRWSDRSEDYRTEVLALVKAQQVKNAVIVPMGAKGCFIAKQLPNDGDREQVLAEGVACYQTYIRGLLDITDNLVAGTVVPPSAVVRHDDDDPYLVVAADKGTATFSDIANAIAVEYGFWLGDAFASGGSEGYDHKQMGITARGAWESVKRHFRERGIDTQSSPFSVVGIGDMAGDVFGNGMLLSETIQLVAAFNHQHIFVDPNPDCPASYAERQRLFALPRCSWSDYNIELISAGGGIFSRSSKRITLSAEMKTRFAIDADQLTPDALTTALLKAPVDMLWNGGIGTYVKSSTESHADVGDKANDGLRIDGNELRCRVLGEGGNLGFTQRGRIEFGLRGGASNTDFIDNAGGVDCSDHEVNIKILLNEQVAEGALSMAQRNQLLRQMTDEVAQRVLHNNYRQAQALSIAERHATESLDEYIQLIDSMEASGKLDRQLEFLPDRKTLLERREQGKGLTRPELSVLISYTKIELKQALINSWVTEDPYLAQEMNSAFPAQLLQRFPEAVGNHRLRPEIAATQIANDLVNLMGITYLHNLRKATGADHAQIAAAYLIARDIYGIESRWQAIEALDNRVCAEIQAEMMKELSGLLTRASWWLLRRRRNELDFARCINDFRAGIERTVASIEQLQQTIPSQDRWLARHQRYTEAGVPELLSAYTAASTGLYWLLDIIEVAAEINRDVSEVSPIYFELGERLNLPWLDRQIRTYPASNHWQALARNGYRDDLDAQQRAVTINALRDLDSASPAASAIEGWLAQHRVFLHRWEKLLTNMQSSTAVDCAIFSVAINVLLELGSPTG